MKKIIVVAICLMAFANVFAQEAEKKEKTETQEIVIKKTGDKKEKLTVIVDGDNITVNGKPLSEFKDEDIKVSKRKAIMRKGGNISLFSETEPAMAWSFNGDDKPHAFLGVTTEGDNEAKISEVTKESAAAKAGLQKGDVITKIDDKKIENFDDIVEAVSAHKPKDEVTIYYKRDGKEKSAKAVLEERKGDAMAYSFSGPKVKGFAIPPMPAMPNMDFKFDGNINGDFDMADRLKDFHGKLDNFNFAMGKPRLGLKIQDTEEGTGVKVLDVDEGSAAEKAGLKKDDIVTEIGGKKVTNTDEAREQLHENAEKNAYTIKAKRNGTDMNFDIKIPKKLKTTNL